MDLRFITKAFARNLAVSASGDFLTRTGVILELWHAHLVPQAVSAIQEFLTGTWMILELWNARLVPQALVETTRFSLALQEVEER